ncbi:MAG: hypothetical protein ACI9UA_003880 [Pseudoalteromonas tetraodonis]|jgi:hypothetical protein
MKLTLPAALACCFLFAQLPSLAAPPAWNASGVGQLPKQGIASWDLSDDKTRIAVGTISAPGDPNVFLLDAGTGKLLAEWEARVRWVEKVVAGSGGVVYALVTMSSGTAEDFPKVYICEQGKKPVPIPVSAGKGEDPQSVFHWGKPPIISAGCSSVARRLVRR